jgi:hypothetical protein
VRGPICRTGPVAFGGRSALLYDGATVTARMDRDPGAAAAARAAGAALLDAALADATLAGGTLAEVAPAGGGRA